MMSILHYYAPHRCVATDTQDLYLGYNELKGVVSLLNRIQSLEREIKHFNHTHKNGKDFDALVEVQADLLQELFNEIVREVK